MAVICCRFYALIWAGINLSDPTHSSTTEFQKNHFSAAKNRRFKQCKPTLHCCLSHGIKIKTAQRKLRISFVFPLYALNEYELYSIYTAALFSATSQHRNKEKSSVSCTNMYDAIRLYKTMSYDDILSGMTLSGDYYCLLINLLY